MDHAEYIKGIARARGALAVYLILLALSFVVSLMQVIFLSSQGAESSFTVRLVIALIQVAASVVSLMYLYGFWLMAQKYSQKTLKIGTGMLTATTIVGIGLQILIVFGVSPTTPLDPSYSLLILFGSIAMLGVVAAAYIVFGNGLKKLQPVRGDRARTLGKIFFWSGVSTACLIGLPVAFVLWIIGYCMSFKFLAEELHAGSAAPTQNSS